MKTNRDRSRSPLRYGYPNGTVFLALLLQTCATPQSPRPQPAPGPTKEVAMQSPQNPGKEEKPAARPPHAPELVGATSVPFVLTREPTQVTISLRPPSGPARSEAAKGARKVFLTVENVTSRTHAPFYDIYINLPAGQDREPPESFHAGGLATFGLVEASVETDRHPGNGLTDSFDVTALFLRLAKRSDWDPSKLRVTFSPHPWPEPLQVKVGRVAVFVQ